MKIDTLPNLILPGAPKSGSKTLFDSLKGHPKIHTLIRDSFTFTKCNYKARLKKIRNSFSDIEKVNREYIGDASPAYFFVKEVPRRLKRAISGEPKIIFILRDPIERTISHYWHKYKKFQDKRTIKEVFDYGKIKMTEELTLKEKKLVSTFKKKGKISINDLDDCFDNPLLPFRYFYISNYKYHIENFLSEFSKTNIKIILLEKLVSTPKPVFKNLLDFLDINKNYSPSALSQKTNQTQVPKKGGPYRLIHQFIRPIASFFFGNFRPKFLRKIYHALTFQGKPELSKENRRLIENTLNGLQNKQKDYLSEKFNLETDQFWQ